MDKHTPGRFLRATLKKLGLQRDGLGWYEATRHTFASQWVMAGRSIEELKVILGHYSVVMTERYAHLRPDLFAPGVHQAFAIDVTPGGEVVHMQPDPGALNSRTATRPTGPRATSRNQKPNAGAAL